jgi:hypothetical protein
MPVYQLGQLNAGALAQPQVAVQIVPPRTRYINGVPTDILGIVGVASWGPKNSPTLVGSPADAQRLFGVQQLRKYDLASASAISFQVGAYNQRIVRVTDGTDAAASTVLKDTLNATGVTLAAIYSGTVGNTLTAAISNGTMQNTWKLTVTLPGYTPEVFDNIAGTGAALWANLASAVNNGQSGLRGPSQLVVATAGASTALPAAASYTLAGGSDGVTGVLDAQLVGTDGATPQLRAGMYALRGSGVSVLNLVDLTDSTQWSAVTAFALAEGMYYVGQGNAGASYSAVSTSLNTAGVDSYATKVMVGDWPYWQDNLNGQLRMMAPATFEAAKIASQAPHLSSLNKPMAGIVSTQRVLQNQPYSGAEIAAIVTARLDAITNPSPGGNYYAAQTGRNTSSNPATNGDNYTRMTNYIAYTLSAAFGWVIGELQTADLRTSAKAAMVAFLSNLEQQGMIGDVNGGPAFSVQIDKNNNPDSRVALGYLQADVQVKYLSVVFDFLINLEGGQSVVIQTRQ